LLHLLKSGLALPGPKHLRRYVRSWSELT